LPERSVVNANAPAAVNARTGTVKCAANAILGALAMAMPERFPAAHAGASLVMTLSGVDARGRHVIGEIVAGGSGASIKGPGFAGLSTDVGNAHNLPVEMLESALPVRLLRVARRHGSGGAGEHRGGDGVVREYLVLRGPLMLTYRTDRHLSRARGLAGGSDGASAQASLRRADGSVEALSSKASAVLYDGDVLRVETAGGGGWGQPGGDA
jgi:N-methylhydantoinase B